MITIPISPATKRFNSWIWYFDSMTSGQHDCYEAYQIRDYFREIGDSSAYKGLLEVGAELGYWKRLEPDTSTATRTETVNTEKLYGI